jgi:hypothetical protein
MFCENTCSNFANFMRILCEYYKIRGRIRGNTAVPGLVKYEIRGGIRGRFRNVLQFMKVLQHILGKRILLVNVIFRLMLLDGITIIVTTFYMRIYCPDHTSLSIQTPNRDGSLLINMYTCVCQTKVKRKI